jgi:hypothetical protein
VAEGNSNYGITSGGGFSAYYPQPAWQAAAVSGYFTAAAGLGKTPIAGYAANGRAYPDISLAGKNYEVILGGTSYLISGTSASCPAVAGFISNINSARLAIGKGSVGWINPALYAKGSSFVNDITSGNTKCVADGTCCSTGFYATPGWDPASGLGTVNYGKMATLFEALGSNIADSFPSMSPTLSSPPSSPPSVRPSFPPTIRPSFPPTILPSFPPTVHPNSPLGSNIPTASPVFSSSTFRNGATAGIYCDRSGNRNY